jgi:putative endopeptidase
MDNIKHGIDKGNLDLNTLPADDFYQYACGGWMKNNPLTGEYSHYGMFDKLREQNRIQLRELIMGLSETEESKIKGSIAQKVSDLYSLGMDLDRLNKEGATPILPYMKRVAETSSDKLIHTIAWLHTGISSSTIFSSGVGPDRKDSDMNIMYIGEAGLGLGDRDYYLEKSEQNDKIMAAYEVYVKRIMELTGHNQEECERIWHNVITLETEFAKHKKTREESRNPLLGYNMRTLDELCSEFPNIDWRTYFKELKLDVEKANVSSLKFITALNELLPTLDIQTIRDYFEFSVLADGDTLLSEDFTKASFELYDRVMTGKEEPEPRWKRAMAIPNSMFGEAVGELYVNKYFPEENKKYMKALVENLRKALHTHISSLQWMSDQTKKHAIEKLESIRVKIGYPDKWRDYSEIEIDSNKSYLENVLSAALWFTRDNYSKLGKPVDKDEWFMTPQTVNAYYSPVNNEICFPAGILQPPYFDISADDALNYGAIGVVIGHEMTHGFDDQGRHFDKSGNLQEWWTEDDAERFKSLSEKLVKQFDDIEVAPGVHANGTYTLGENIADQGGLRLALTAYHNLLNGEEAPVIDGFTPLQRFYLAYANVWACNIRPEEILARTQTDPHSLGRYRVNQTLKNIIEFQEAFNIKEGSQMYTHPIDKAIIW